MDEEKKEKEQPKNPFKICPEHERDLSMYCKNEKCRMKICQLCLLESHNGHNIKDILKDRHEKLERKIENLTKYNSNYKAKLISAKQIIIDTGGSSLQNLENRKKAQMKLLDDMIEKTKDYLTKSEKDIDEHIATVEEQLLRLDNVKTKLKTTNNLSVSDFEDVENAENSAKENPRLFKYLKYNDEYCNMQCGHLSEEEVRLPKFHTVSSFITQGKSYISVPTTNQILRSVDLGWFKNVHSPNLGNASYTAMKILTPPGSDK